MFWFALALLCLAVAAFGEECESDVEFGPGSCIEKPYEIDNVLITIFWFDTEEELRAYQKKHFKVDDKLVRAFSGSEPYETKNVCHLDMYVVRPTYVDDDRTLSVGHEVLHCVYGPDYHVIW